MTDEEKEIRDSERRVMNECRRLRRATNKKLLAMTSEELHEYWRKRAEELRAEGFTVIMSPDRPPKSINPPDSLIYT